MVLTFSYEHTYADLDILIETDQCKKTRTSSNLISHESFAIAPRRYALYFCEQGHAIFKYLSKYRLLTFQVSSTGPH